MNDVNLILQKFMTAVCHNTQFDPQLPEFIQHLFYVIFKRVNFAEMVPLAMVKVLMSNMFRFVIRIK